MKLICIIVSVCFVKACLCAPIESNNKSYTENVQSLRVSLLQQPGMNRAHVDRFSEALSTLENGPTPDCDKWTDALVEILGFAVQGDGPTNDPVDLKPAMQYVKEHPKNNESMAMVKVLTPKQLHHASEILGGMMREDATEAERAAAINDLITSSVASLKKEALFNVLAIFTFLNTP